MSSVDQTKDAGAGTVPGDQHVKPSDSAAPSKPQDSDVGDVPDPDEDDLDDLDGMVAKAMFEEC